MTKTKRPSEFFSDWHFEQHKENLAREIRGYLIHLEEAKARPKGDPYRAQQIEGYENSLKAAQAELDHYTGHKGAATRPAKAASTR